MAVEKCQNHEGHDNPNHAGWRSHQQRMANADQSLIDFLIEPETVNYRIYPQKTTPLPSPIRKKGLGDTSLDTGDTLLEDSQ